MVSPFAIVFVISRMVVANDPSVAQAEELETALGNYRKKENEYPCGVTKLIPEYLPQKPDRLILGTSNNSIFATSA